jgi:molecular chaperone DnaK
LSEADIDKMVKDAEVHAAEDKKRRELVDAKNQGEAMVHSAEKSLAEFGDKVSEADRSAIEAAKAALKTALEGDDVEAIKARTNDLVQASMKLGEAMYKAQAGGAGGPDGGAPGAGGDAGAGGGHEAKNDDVIDADFKEVGGDHKKSA